LACPRKLNVQKVNCRELLPNSVNRLVVATWKGGWLEPEKQKKNTKLECSYHMPKIFWFWIPVASHGSDGSALILLNGLLI
jgi:hypothetical protein